MSTTYLRDRFYAGEPTSFGSNSLPHEIYSQDVRNGEVVVEAEGFRVVLPREIVMAIAAIVNDRRYPLLTS